MCDDSGVPHDEIHYRFKDFPFNPHCFRHGQQGIVFGTNHKNFPGVSLGVKQFHTNQQSSLAAQRELELIKKAQGHKAIVRFHGYLYHDTIPNFRIGYIMDYIPLSLEDVVIDNTLQYNYNVMDGISWMNDLTGAVSYLHRMEIVHRDIKPSNLLIKWNKVGKPLILCDFGCGRGFDAGILSTSCGTEHYCSPELLNHSGKYGKSTDVYSVGRVLWEVFHRERAPFNREEIVEGTFEHLVFRFPFSNLIKRCLRFDPGDRPHMEEIRLTIDTILNKMFELLRYRRTKGMSYSSTQLCQRLYKDRIKIHSLNCAFIDENFLLLIKVTGVNNLILNQSKSEIYCLHDVGSALYVYNSWERLLPFDKLGERQSETTSFSWSKFLSEMVELKKSRKLRIERDKERSMNKTAKKRGRKGIEKRRRKLKKTCSETKGKRGSRLLSPTI